MALCSTCPKWRRSSVDRTIENIQVIHGDITEEQCVSMKEIADSIANLEDMVSSLASLVNEYSL